MRDFKVGDKVAFEIQSNGNPRWDYETGWPGSGKYVEAEVVRVDVYRGSPAFMISYEFMNKEIRWWWPQPSVSKFQNCYRNLGFIYLLKNKIKSNINTHICTCPKENFKWFGGGAIGCTCGGK